MVTHHHYDWLYFWECFLRCIHLHADNVYVLMAVHTFPCNTGYHGLFVRSSHPSLDLLLATLWFAQAVDQHLAWLQNFSRQARKKDEESERVLPTCTDYCLVRRVHWRLEVMEVTCWVVLAYLRLCHVLEVHKRRTLRRLEHRWAVCCRLFVDLSFFQPKFAMPGW